MEFASDRILEAGRARLHDREAARREHHVARGSVVRWAWAAEGTALHEAEPVERGFAQLGPIRLRADQPARNGERYGFDAHGELRFVELRSDDQDAPAELSIIDTAAGRDLRTLNFGEQTWSLSQEFASAGVPVARIDFSDSGASLDALVREYEVAGGRIERMRSALARDWGEGWIVDPAVSFRAEYAGDALSALLRMDDGHETAVWSAARRGETHAKVLRRWQAALVRAVPPLAAHAATPEGTVHAVTFWYDDGEPYQAQLVIWFEDPRLVAAGAQDEESRWNPRAAVVSGAADAIDLQRADPELAEIDAAVRRTRSSLEEPQSAGAERKVLVAAAKALNAPRTTWPCRRPADAFAVWPAEHQLVGLEADLEGALPARVRRALG